MPFSSALQLAYISLVTTAWVKPKMFPPREKGPVARQLLAAHNMFLIMWSSAIALTVSHSVWTRSYGLWRNEVDLSDSNMVMAFNHFAYTKVYEFADTAFIIYFGNLRQLSFLHVYHHLVASTLGFLTAADAPGGDGWFAVVGNSVVHVVMYSYYMASALQIDKRWLMWGRYLTQMQILQFVVIMFQHSASFIGGTYPRYLLGANMVFLSTLMVLFSKFYTKKWTQVTLVANNEQKTT